MDKIKDFLQGMNFKFEGVSPKFTSNDSKLLLDLNLKMSLNLQGDHEALIAEVLNGLMGLGNLQKSLSDSNN